MIFSVNESDVNISKKGHIPQIFVPIHTPVTSPCGRCRQDHRDGASQPHRSLKAPLAKVVSVCSGQTKWSENCGLRCCTGTMTQSHSQETLEEDCPPNAGQNSGCCRWHGPQAAWHGVRSWRENSSKRLTQNVQPLISVTWDSKPSWQKHNRILVALDCAYSSEP